MALTVEQGMVRLLAHLHSDDRMGTVQLLVLRQGQLLIKVQQVPLGIDRIANRHTSRNLQQNRRLMIITSMKLQATNQEIRTTFLAL